MVNSDVIRNRTLYNGNDRAAHDGHIQNSGSISRQRPKLSYAQSEDAGEHDGVEEPDKDHAPHCQMAAGEHGNDNQHRRTDCA